MQIARLLCCLSLIVASCETYQYTPAQTFNDMTQQDTHDATTTDISTDNEFTIQSSSFLIDYFGISNSCQIDISMAGKFEFPPRCQLNGTHSGFAQDDNCISLFRVDLLNEKNNKVPDTTSGNWKISISGSYKTRNYFSLQGNDNFAYWADAMEIYLIQGLTRHYLGTIQGDSWSQADPLKVDNLLFEHSIPANMKIESIHLRFTRRCKSSNFNFNNLDTIPQALTDPQLSKFIISNIKFTQAK